jgi:hypothetical protein
VVQRFERGENSPTGILNEISLLHARHRPHPILRTCLSSVAGLSVVLST